MTLSRSENENAQGKIVTKYVSDKVLISRKYKGTLIIQQKTNNPTLK